VTFDEAAAEYVRRGSATADPVPGSVAFAVSGDGRKLKITWIEACERGGVSFSVAVWHDEDLDVKAFVTDLLDIARGLP
jgi:hypothetical protein